ncbi:hypothetical protein, secreted, partial [gut metagenome]
MKVMIAGMLCCLLSVACTNKQKTDLPEAKSDSDVTVIGGVQNDSIGTIAQENTNLGQDRDTVIFEMPDCYLWYRKDVKNSASKQKYQLWTERKVYWQNVKVINVFMANYTDQPLAFNGEWILQQWDGKEWKELAMK